MSLNIRSLNLHYCQLKETVQNFSTDIIAMSEIWKPHTPFVNIPNYHPLIAKTRPTNRTGGGVGLYINEKLTYEDMEEINTLQLKKTEIIGVKIKPKNLANLIVIAAYNPPNSKLKETLEDMEMILQALNNQPAVLTGDFNINVAADNALSKKYIDKLSEYFMTQTVKTNTRITAKSSTTIDHVFSNLASIKTIVTHMAISDHQVLISLLGHKPTESGKTNPTTNRPQINLEKRKKPLTT